MPLSWQRFWLIRSSATSTSIFPGMRLPSTYVSSPEATRVTADLLNRYPERFLFGTDEVAPSSQEKYLKVYYQYEPLWKLLDANTREKVTKGNYERIFDEGRQKVRAWEMAQGLNRANNPQ